MSKHTPGPWNREAIGRLLRFSSRNSGPWDDEDIWPDDSMCIPDEDDAALIAQAPELLEALESLLKLVENNWLDEHWDAEEWACYDKYRDVIAKAKGETG